MDVEKMYNNWYEQAKKELDKRKKMNNLYTECMLLKYYNMAVPTVKQQENGDYSISLAFDYWNKDENQKLKDSEKLVNQLKKYFDNTSKDALEKEMEKYKYLNEIGPYVPTDEEELKRNWEVLKEYENVEPNALDFVKSLEKHLENETFYKEK